MGRDDLVAHLRGHHVTTRHAAKVANRALAASAAQSLTLPGADTAAALAAELALSLPETHPGL